MLLTVFSVECSIEEFLQYFVSTMYPGWQGGDDGGTAPAKKQAKVTSDTSDQILTHFMFYSKFEIFFSQAEPEHRNCNFLWRPRGWSSLLKGRMKKSNLWTISHFPS